MRSALRVSLIVGFVSWASAAHGENYLYHPNSPIYIGGNFDPSFPGQAFPECLVRTHERAESLLPGQVPGTAADTQFFIKSVESRERLYRMLNVSLSLSGSYGLFSADYSGSLEQENAFEKEQYTWVIYGYSAFGRFIIDKQELNKRGNAASVDPIRFRSTCGTDYVQMGVRAVQAAAVFTIKNLSQSQRQVIEHSLSANYGSGSFSVGGDVQYRSFIETAAKYGQIEVNVYAMGGPGVSRLAPIIDNVKDPAIVLRTLREYFENLTLAQSRFVSYQSGSVQSLTGKQTIDMAIYNRMISDIFQKYESLAAEKARLEEISAHPEDWSLTEEQKVVIAPEINRITGLQSNLLRMAQACKASFNAMTGDARALRQRKCDPVQIPGQAYARILGTVQPKPFNLNYFVMNDLIPGEEMINFTVTGPTVETVFLVKQITPAGSVDVNSIQVHKSPNGMAQAGTSVLMKDFLDAELPLGVRVALASGRSMTTPFVFTRAPAVGGGAVPLSGTVRAYSGRFSVSKVQPLTDADRKKYEAAYLSGELVPDFVVPK